jgi:hypothetical protein
MRQQTDVLFLSQGYTSTTDMFLSPFMWLRLRLLPARLLLQSRKGDVKRGYF